MDLSNWKKLKRSGSYRQKVKRRYESMIVTNSRVATSTARTDTEHISTGSVETSTLISNEHDLPDEENSEEDRYIYSS